MYFTLAEMCQAGRTTERGVRLWDSKGLLGVVERNGYNAERLFTAEHMRRARIIAAAQTADWPLARIRAYLDTPTPAEQAKLCADLFNTSAFMHDVRSLLEFSGQPVFDL